MPSRRAGEDPSSEARGQHLNNSRVTESTATCELEEDDIALRGDVEKNRVNTESLILAQDERWRRA